MKVFHVSQPGLPPRFCIEPGRFGGGLRIWQAGTLPADPRLVGTLAWEACLETARQSICPEKPSRLNCVFACISEADALSFRDAFRPGGNIYEAELLTAGPTHLGSFDLLKNTGGGAYVDHWPERAQRYWREPPEGEAELLCSMPVRLLRAVG